MITNKLIQGEIYVTMYRMPLIPPFAIDLAVSHFTQGFQSPWLTGFLKLVSLIFDPIIETGVAAILVVYLVYAKRHSHAAKVASLMAGNALAPLLKLFFSRPRPETQAVHVLIHQFGYGFPSGHALGIVLFSAVVIFAWQSQRKFPRRGLIATCGIVSIVVGLSRVYLGVHWVTDVIAGYIVAGCWIGLCAAIIWPYIDRIFNQRKALV